VYLIIAFIIPRGKIPVDNIPVMEETVAPFQKNNPLFTRGSMLLRMEHLSGVDNARNYSPEIIKELEQLLLAGGSASPDHRRKGFYDLENRERTFFIHISPITGRVVLLAVWLRPECVVDQAEQVETGSGCTA